MWGSNPVADGSAARALPWLMLPPTIEPLVPSFCPHCKWGAKMSTPHLQGCSSQNITPTPTEVFPGLWVGAAEARADPRFNAVVGILTSGEMRVKGAIPAPAGPYYHIDQEDRTPGLLAQAPAAWKWVDDQRAATPDAQILFHCRFGASRSPVVLLGYAVSRGLTTLRAGAETLIAKRPLAMNIWYGYQEELVAMFEAAALEAAAAELERQVREWREEEARRMAEKAIGRRS